MLGFEFIEALFLFYLAFLQLIFEEPDRIAPAIDNRL
jgi:hypothetical protein